MLVIVPGTREEGAYSMTVLGRLWGGGGNIRRLGRPSRMRSQPGTFLAGRVVSVGIAGDLVSVESSVSVPWVTWV